MQVSSLAFGVCVIYKMGISVHLKESENVKALPQTPKSKNENISAKYLIRIGECEFKRKALFVKSCPGDGCMF